MCGQEQLHVERNRGGAERDFCFVLSAVLYY